MKAKDEAAMTRAPDRRGRRALKANVLRVEVIRAHDGINKGEILIKSRATAEMMIAKGFYKKALEE